MDEDVDQQRCDGVEHADKDPGDDDHLHEGFGAALHVIDVDRHRLGATGCHKDPGGDAEEGPAEIGDHGLYRDGVSRLYAARQCRTCQQNVGEVSSSIRDEVTEVMGPSILAPLVET